MAGKPGISRATGWMEGSIMATVMEKHTMKPGTK